MNILLINHYAGSPLHGMEYRPWYLARHWQLMGHRVTVVAASQAHVRSTQPTVEDAMKQEEVMGVPYLWVNTPAYQGNGVGRVRNMWRFVRFLKKKASWLADEFKPGVVIASSTYPLDNYPAYDIARRAGARYFYEVHDLWPLSPMELGGMSKAHPFIVWMQMAENFACRHADIVVSMLPKTREHFVAHGLKPGKWHYIPNGIARGDWESPAPLRSNLQLSMTDISRQYRAVVAYTGSFGVANALDAFVRAAALPQSKDKAFVLAGGGPEEAKLRRLRDELKASNVFFLGQLPKAQIPALLARCDVLYVGLQKQALFRFGISPNKIMDYMMAEKPVIQAIEAGNNMVEESGCGLSVEPENPEALAGALQQILSWPESKRRSAGAAGKSYVLKNHDYEVLAARFIRLMEE